MDYTGMWHIYEMEMWDEDYFNMETQAYINITSNNLGDFQFGLVSGQIDGELTEEEKRGKLFEFTWDGNDENDSAFGSGWLRLKDEHFLEGQIKLHLGDSSKFYAKRLINSSDGE